jgi:hypothetical protein
MLKKLLLAIAALFFGDPGAITFAEAAGVHKDEDHDPLEPVEPKSPV